MTEIFLGTVEYDEGDAGAPVPAPHLEIKISCEGADGGGVANQLRAGKFPHPTASSGVNVSELGAIISPHQTPGKASHPYPSAWCVRIWSHQ